MVNRRKRIFAVTGATPDGVPTVLVETSAIKTEESASGDFTAKKKEHVQYMYMPKMVYMPR